MKNIDNPNYNELKKECLMYVEKIRESNFCIGDTAISFYNECVGKGFQVLEINDSVIYYEYDPFGDTSGLELQDIFVYTYCIDLENMLLIHKMVKNDRESGEYTLCIDNIDHILLLLKYINNNVRKDISREMFMILDGSDQSKKFKDYLRRLINKKGAIIREDRSIQNDLTQYRKETYNIQDKYGY